MTEDQEKRPGQSGDDEPIPLMQRLMDSPFVLLVLGLTIPGVIYLVWGILEVALIPLAP